MPVAPSQKDSPVLRYRRGAPKPQNHQCNAHSSVVTSNRFSHNSDIVTNLGHLTAIATNSDSDNLGHVFSTRSPPILNLSPNLSPTEPQQVSPFYDLRESTRRRGLQDINCNIRQNSPQIISDLEDSDQKSNESPSRKRRKTSNNVLTDSPSPPSEYLSWPSESYEAVRATRTRGSLSRRTLSDRYTMQARPRRSPGMRRRSSRVRSEQEVTFDHRNPYHMASTTGPAQSVPVLHSQQTPMVHGNIPLHMGPYAIPLCTPPHALCHQAPYPHTWPLPACTVPIGHFPTCSLQHIPLSSMSVPAQSPYTNASTQQLPLPLAPGPPPRTHQYSTHHPLPPHPHTQLHIVPPSAPPQMRQNPTTSVEDMRRLAEQRVSFSLSASRLPRNPVVNSSAPILLHDTHPTVHPTLPTDIYPSQEHHPGFFYSTPQQTMPLNRLPPIPHSPPFLLQFLAMLGRPTLPPYRININNNYTEAENYEALLHLAERLGEAKPRGLSKHDIEQLPAYRFNSDTHTSHSDQTSCVVCMCDFENRQLLRVLPCSHEFHAKCVDRWLKTNRTCPICRADTMGLASQSD